MLAVLSPLWLGTATQPCQPVCRGALCKAAPSSSGHHHVLHQGHCRATAEPSLCHCHWAVSSPDQAALWPANEEVSGCREEDPGGTGVPGERQMVCFRSAGTQSLLWCNVMAESTAPACGIIPQCPDGTGVAAPAENAALGTGCRAGIAGAETRQETRDVAEASAAQVTAHRGTRPRPGTKTRETPVKKGSAATLWEDSGPDATWQVRVSHSGTYQCPAERDKPSQGYSIFHRKHNPETSL